MADSASVLGAIRQQILAAPSLVTAIPGKIHTNELPKDATYPAVVLRFARTEFQYMTLGYSQNGQHTRTWIERPRIELWVECLHSDSGESLARQIQAQVVDKALPFSVTTTVQIFPVDFFLAPETGRNADGVKQYSWCLVLEAWFNPTA